MKLPYDPPTLLSDIVSSLVMLVILLAVTVWIIRRIYDELPGSNKARSDADVGPST